MSAPRKLKGNTASEITRLKKLWLGWSDAEREAWRSLFCSDTTQADIRQRLKVEVNISLIRDAQLTEFRKWMAEQDARDAEAEATQQDQEELEKLGLSGDALRSALLDKIKGRAYLRGDHKLGLQAVDRDLESVKLEDSRKGEGQRALEYCLAEAKAYPAVMEMFKSAFAALKQAKEGTKN